MAKVRITEIEEDPNKIQCDTGFGGNEWILPNIEGVHRTIGEQHVFADIMQLVDWVRDGKPSVATAEHARHVVEIIEAGYRSAATGQRQSLRTTF
jgi:predicted dehydrogenase